MPGGFAKCTSLDECFHALDLVAAQRMFGSTSAGDEQFAVRLEQFGKPAKRELLKRAAGDDRGWRNLADAILLYWQSYDPADVPLLIEALHKNPGGWVARPLGRIGTQGAIDALAEDVRLHGAASQSGFALAQLGDRVFPYLLPLLSDDKRWRVAAEIMRDMKSKAADGLNAWLAIALDPTKPERDRVGALRGIGVLGTSAKQVAFQIRAILAGDSEHGPISDAAEKVLAAMGDKAVAAEAATSCLPSTDSFEGSFDSTTCLERAAVFGDAILSYANLILTRFTNSENGTDRANGASLLGYIGYSSATARLIEMLGDSDWRVVYAAIRSLGWLNAKTAIPALTKVSNHHWLADVRAEAAKVVSVLQSQGGSVARPVPRAGTLEFPPRVPLEIDATLAPDIAPCKSGRWKWNGREFGEPDHVNMTLKVSAHGSLSAGVLAGRDSGEWGGEVKWETASADPLFLATGNVEGIEPSSEGAIAVIGTCCGDWRDYDPKRAIDPSHAIETINVGNGPGGGGYALAIRRDQTGAWRVKQIARFPRAAFGLTTIGRDLFAAWSGNRAIVFRPSGIAGIAPCVGQK